MLNAAHNVTALWNEDLTPDNMTTKTSVFTQLRNLGYTKGFIESVLPDWWDFEVLKSSAGVLELAMLINRRLGLTAQVNDGQLVFSSKPIKAKYKAIASKNKDLSHVTSLGRAVANMLTTATDFSEVPQDPFTLRKEILSDGEEVLTFENLLNFCWKVGIPVIYLSKLPPRSKRPMGMSIMIKDQPAIILSHRSTSSAKQLFILAHEIGHIALNHLEFDSLLIDESLGLLNETLRSPDEDVQEQEADEFALTLIRGSHNADISEFLPNNPSPSEVAVEAIKLGKTTMIDAVHLLLSYGHKTGNWKTAMQATGYLEESIDALEATRAAFTTYFDLDSISTEDADYLVTLMR